VRQIRLSPNPTTGLLALSGVEDLEGKASYTLVNAMGQPVQQGLVHARLDLSRHPNGLYVLLIRMPGGSIWSEKVVLAR
ncbi:T9SS type A sorting domain-containing protein, partial [Arthrospira platensis SPKY1]|nr:T9SS type A sorting domain-containing protein [Arthrospira platensis SPKY1]